MRLTPPPWQRSPPALADRLAARTDDGIDAVWSALRRLLSRDQALMLILVADPQPSYTEIGATLETPIGSIGPRRARALDRLREEPERRP
jgi:DNA-directed RNA polymerase specialized sigma24 family protein